MRIKLFPSCSFHDHPQNSHKKQTRTSRQGRTTLQERATWGLETRRSDTERYGTWTFLARFYFSLLVNTNRPPFIEVSHQTIGKSWEIHEFYFLAIFTNWFLRTFPQRTWENSGLLDWRPLPSAVASIGDPLVSLRKIKPSTYWCRIRNESRMTWRFS